MKYEDVYELVDQHVDDTPENKEKAARAIHAYYFPTYKPLNELHKDIEACRKVFEFIVGGDVEFGEVRYSNDNSFTVLYEFKPGYYGDAEPMHEIIIHKNASILWMKGEMAISDYNVFALSDFIRSLGYSA